RVKSLQEKIAGYQYVLANPGWTTGDGFMINHLTSVKTVTEGLSQATEQLAVEQSRLAQMQEKAQSIQDVLAGLEDRRVALIRQQSRIRCTSPCWSLTLACLLWDRIFPGNVLVNLKICF
ncbi:hypothetical protein EJ382_22860, partial [Escherichia coli]|nr:hypothetical protein [Escherichia coli]